MFKNEDLEEFVRKIVIQTKDKQETKESLEKLKKYLELTTMTEEGMIQMIDNTILCLDEIISIYQKTNVCDLSPFIGKNDRKVKQRKLTKQEEKHYDRYIDPRVGISSCEHTKPKIASRC